MKTWLRRKSVFVLALGVVIAVRVLLYCVKFTKIQKWFVSPTPQKPSNMARARIIARTVERAAVFVPKASCLTQALACQSILSWFGEPSNIRIGAAKTNLQSTDAESKAVNPHNSDIQHANSDVDFHAWLLWDDKIILGGRELQTKQFSVLASFSSTAT